MATWLRASCFIFSFCLYRFLQSEKNDLYYNRLSPSPYCTCSNVIEDAGHFFFNCPNCPDKRITLFTSIRNYHPLNINKLLTMTLTWQFKIIPISFWLCCSKLSKNTGRFTNSLKMLTLNELQMLFPSSSTPLSIHLTTLFIINTHTRAHACTHTLIYYYYYFISISF